MKHVRRLLIILFCFVAFLGIALFFLARKEVPEKIQYGMTFNTMYANELGLDWKETYDAILDELGVRHLRLADERPAVGA